MNQIKKILMPLTGLAAVACAQPKQQLPNVIYVFPDQYRNQALDFWNQPEYNQFVGWQADPVQTPRLNEFANESVVFSRAMSNCPLSSPHRGILLSGMYPERNGIVLNCMSERPESSLRQDATCISDVFKAAGYSCGYIGKLHTDAPTRNNPQKPGEYVDPRMPVWDAYTPAERRHGFDYWYSYGTFDEHKNPHYWDNDGNRYDPKEYSVKHETDRAIEYLQNTKGQRDENKPFFLCVAYNPPHSPYQCLDDCMEEDYNLYKNMHYKDLYVRDNADTTLVKAPAARYYFANVTGVDRNFGRILDEVKRLGLDDNTIVVFTSDHGETMCSQGTVDPKNSIYTESFNVPYMIRYPKKIRHRVDTTIFSSIDIMPTILGLAGLGDQIPETAEGRNIAPIILENGEECDVPESALYIKNVNGPKDENGLVHGFFPIARGIKTHQYSFEIAINRNYEISHVRIFDDINDPYQMTNIPYKKHPELYKELFEQLAAKLEEANDIWFSEHIIDKIR